MYDVAHYTESDLQVVKAFIGKNPFAFLTGCDPENKPVATQIPVFVVEDEGRFVVRGHLMKNTDHYKAMLHNEHILVVFTGHHAYVSATWYSNPSVASTWNYMSVHAKGIIRFLDENALEDVLQKTTLHFENYDHQSPTVFNNLPSEYRQRTIKAIVAFEIEVTELKNIFKLSQEKDAESYQNIIKHLENQGENGKGIAEEMEKRSGDLFRDHSK